MSWAVEWHHAAIHGFLWLPMRTAERLARAVLRFAETSQGPVQRVSPLDHRRLMLTVPGAIAFLFLDEEEGVIRVGRVLRRG